MPCASILLPFRVAWHLDLVPAIAHLTCWTLPEPRFSPALGRESSTTSAGDSFVSSCTCQVSVEPPFLCRRPQARLVSRSCLRHSRRLSLWGWTAGCERGSSQKIFAMSSSEGR